ncbi:keywimysin-related RiPP [Kitasatospora sp. NPDC101183]
MKKAVYETPEFVAAGTFRQVTGFIYWAGNDGSNRGWL